MPRMSGGSSQWEVDRVDDRWPLNVGSRRRENRPVYANTGHSPMTGHMAEANHTIPAFAAMGLWPCVGGKSIADQVFVLFAWWGGI
jgi:hypothetical protein